MNILDKIKRFTSEKFGVPEEKGALWVLVNPKKPHISFLTFSDEIQPPWENGIRLTGISMSGTPAIYGMIIDWGKFSLEEQEQIKTGYLDLPIKSFLNMVRPKFVEGGV